MIEEETDQAQEVEEEDPDLAPEEEETDHAQEVEEDQDLAQEVEKVMIR